MGSGLRRNAIPQRGFARMPLSSATQPLGCHPREFGAFYFPSTPPFSLFLSRSRLGRTEREPRTDRALGLFSSVAEVPHGRPLDPPSHARPTPCNRVLPHARPRSASSPTPAWPSFACAACTPWPAPALLGAAAAPPRRPWTTPRQRRPQGRTSTQYREAEGFQTMKSLLFIAQTVCVGF